MSSSLSRRRFLATASLGVAATVAGQPATAAFAAQPDTGGTITANDALKLLTDGNHRWVTGQVTHPHQSVARRVALRNKQNPFATVFSCIDSRVPPELVFDTGIGDLAVIRTGAQVLDQGIVLGSIAFTPGHLHTPLIMVMGHQRCGAVVAAIETIRSGGTAPGHIQAVVDALRPAYAIAVRQRGDLVENMVRAQTRVTVQALKKDPLIRDFIDKGKLGVVGGYYSLDSGAVKLIA